MDDLSGVSPALLFPLDSTHTDYLAPELPLDRVEARKCHIAASTFNVTGRVNPGTIANIFSLGKLLSDNIFFKHFLWKCLVKNGAESVGFCPSAIGFLTPLCCIFAALLSDKNAQLSGA